jgi:monofunctional biosynthetic peptidoglycan transglycosylase
MNNYQVNADKYLQKNSNHHFRKALHFIKNHKLISILSLSLAGILILSIYFYYSLPDVEWLKNKNPKITALMQQRIDEARSKGEKLKIYQRWVSFSSIPANLKNAVRISEDAAFYLHNGIDFEELKNAFKENWKKGKLVRGGSTITQQLAKNLFLSTDKSYSRKIKEYFIAKRLEAALSKNRIFHLYLNVIEFGRGIFGVQAASRFYFGKNVSQLTLSEIARLTAIIPRPLKISPKSSSKRLKYRANHILKKLKQYHFISPEEYRAALLK